MKVEAENEDLGKTRITDKIRVSSAAIHYGDSGFGAYYQLETWVFSDDKSQRNMQVIHRTVFQIRDIHRKEVAKIHKYIADGMFSKHNVNPEL